MNEYKIIHTHSSTPFGPSTSVTHDGPFALILNEDKVTGAKMIFVSDPPMATPEKVVKKGKKR
jgi:hypothetical protein